MAKWTFITNYGAVLNFIAENRQARAIDIAAALGITERSVRRITADLEACGYVSKTRHGRINQYTINPNLPLRRSVNRDITVGELLKTLNREQH
jgi:DeoR/GlpR family transcriptional regulator of sugar metabolism